MVLISSLLIAFSMSMYQTYLSVTMVLALATLIIDVLENKDKKEICKNILKFIITGVLGLILYYGMSHIILLIKQLNASSYSGGNNVGINTILNIPNLIPEAYQSFINYFFNDEMIPNTIWGTNIFYIIIFAMIFVATIYIVIKNKVYKNKLNTLLLILFIAIAPMFFGIIEIVLPDVDIHILMACSMIFVFPIFFKILEILPEDKMSKLIKYVTVFCSLAICWIYIWQDNASYNAMKMMQNQAEATVNRIVTQIESLDDYEPDMPVLFLGGLEGNKYLNRQNTSFEAKKVFDKSWGFISGKPTIWWGNLDSWNKLLYEYLGVNLKLVPEWEDNSKKIFETQDYKNMNFYPEKDSIKIINNTVVVKLSD